MKKTNKKGLTLGQLVPAIITLVIVVVLLTVGLKLTTDMRDKAMGTTSANKNATAYQGVNDSMQSLVEISGWGDLIGLVVAASVILGLVLGAIALRGGRV